MLATTNILHRQSTHTDSPEYTIQRYNLKRQTPLTLNLPTTTIVAQPFNVIKWQLKFNPVA